MAWLDLENAFGSEPHQFIFSAIEHSGMPKRLISLISALYTDGTSTIRTSTDWTDPIAMKAGVRQGCSLTAILFNLSLDQLLRTGQEAYKYLGVRVGLNYKQNNNGFFRNIASDVKLVANSPLAEAHHDSGPRSCQSGVPTKELPHPEEECRRAH
ncbi:hypothetical protein NPIL_123381 [Nephila pilipes]|uniref:Reverse transcriptase domain-containing protein n=1 Tax=Nephila pilipes TaxID=299642 RepID=A0A8X6M695_NEPPI|nr:hypothetical protein NPIL_123381 [Nephila pilipes]